jgi:hypothetical protein
MRERISSVFHWKSDGDILHRTALVEDVVGLDKGVNTREWDHGTIRLPYYPRIKYLPYLWFSGLSVVTLLFQMMSSEAQGTKIQNDSAAGWQLVWALQAEGSRSFYSS